MTATCSTCKHWGPSEPDWEFDSLNFATCRAIKQRETIRDEAFDEADERWGEKAEAAMLLAMAAAKAIAVDGSGYYAAVRTAPDFGCALHQALAAEDQA